MRRELLKKFRRLFDEEAICCMLSLLNIMAIISLR